jgi:SET domain-containing protein
MKLISCNLSVCQSSIHGWGLFTNEFIKKDQIINQSIGINFPQGSECSIELIKYVYTHTNGLIVFLGHASWINSSKTPNAIFNIDSVQNVITITAIQDINPLEEITLNYINQ